MSKLDLEWLAVFDEVYKTGNVSKAAERLGMAQAAASTALNKLRAHFDDRLFTRTAQGMQPTPHAERIYPNLREVLAQLAQAQGNRSSFEPAEAQRRFRICMTDISEVVLLPGLLDHLRHVAPGVHIETEIISTNSGRRLQDGEVDLAVGFMPQLDAGFYQQTLFMQNFVCLAAQNHPRIGARLARKRFEAEAHAVVSTSGTGHAIVDTTIARLGLKRDVVVRLSSFLSVARIVAHTELLVVVPRILGKVLATQEPVKLLELPFALPDYAVKQHWHERFHADPGNAWLRRTLAQLFSGS
ncbi:DNA-binding transcriptional LysR family regulator [Variovorax boronicumulans]|uniref:LysR family transcriptional regulator n=1 Tax=Variovorax boronicumulans TaxID=436515 RepID=UPI00277F317B|nr:LysR family transcriptional regulator [Variovorax boronicumulans]MDP9996194.1 DNA-binding transcriptional LysR family regulator [Variovorax boronicumulans]MDQ0007377.1 DNA-binding transcriptional LysR family regulator [Variovorax boronicumulans]